jgi:serine/threonine-protein kinase RsbW
MRTRVIRTGEPDDVRFCLVFPREALSVPVMRHVLGDTLTQLGLDPDSISDLLLAVTEACTNVLRHSGRGHRYEVVARIDRNRCVLQVLDSGRGLDPSVAASLRPAGRGSGAGSGTFTLPRPSAIRPRMAWGRRAGERAVARLPESGRGLAIMRACVDDVTLRSRPGRGTVVSLRKRIELRSDAPLTAPDPREEPAPLRHAG